MTSSPPTPDDGRSGWAAAIEELQRLRREERAADDADEESTAAELRRAFADRTVRRRPSDRGAADRRR